jgi:hypothetical protein
MSKVTQLRPDLMKIEAPAELRALRAWCVWKLVQRPGEPKPRKMPYYASGAVRAGVQGSEGDRARLVSFEEARRVAATLGYQGVGFCPMPEHEILCVDFDDVMQKEEKINHTTFYVQGTYAELSPSGNGVRAFFKGKGFNRKSHAIGADGKRQWPYTFETFASKGFVTFTGNKLGDAPLSVAPIGERISALIAERWPVSERAAARTAPSGATDEYLAELLAALDPSMGRDDWIRVGMALHHETGGEGFDLWDNWSADGDTYPGHDDLQRQWESFSRPRGENVPDVTIGTLRALYKSATGKAPPSRVSSPSDFDVIEDSAEEKQARARFTPIPAAEFAALPSPGWMIKGILPVADLGMVYGPPASGKSFVVLDMAMALARGVPWLGRKTRQCRVAYICAEGAGGFRKRLKAYSVAHDVDLEGLDLVIIPEKPNFHTSPDDIRAVGKGLEACGGVELIIVDTLAQVSAGADENSGEDMGLVLERLRWLEQKTGAMILLVHHTGKDTNRGARGWSGMTGAIDAGFEVVLEDEEGRKRRRLEIAKLKDEDDNSQWTFHLEVQQVGVDEDDDAITSCSVVFEEGSVKRVSEKKPREGAWASAIMRAFEELELLDSRVSMPELIEAAVNLRVEEGVSEGRAELKWNCKRAVGVLVRGKRLTAVGEVVIRAEGL